MTKAAYLFVAIIKGHIYTNGNKRLGLVTAVYFLIINGYELNVKPGELYELCIYIADRERNNDSKFDQLKEYTEKFLEYHMVRHGRNI